MQVRKQQLELDMEQQTGSKYEKEYIKSVKHIVNILRNLIVNFLVGLPIDHIVVLDDGGNF